MNVEQIELRFASLQREIDLLKGMVDTERSVITAQIVKIDDPSSPQILRVSEGGTLELGSESGMRVIGAITEEASHTGDTDETELGKITVPGDSMGPKGFVRIFASFRAMGASTHYFYVYFGGALVSYWNAATTNYMLDLTTAYVWNRGAANSQGSGIEDAARHVKNTETPFSETIDTTNDVDITFAVKNAAGDTGYLCFALVEALYRD